MFYLTKSLPQLIVLFVDLLSLIPFGGQSNLERIDFTFERVDHCVLELMRDYRGGRVERWINASFPFLFLGRWPLRLFLSWVVLVLRWCSQWRIIIFLFCLAWWPVWFLSAWDFGCVAQFSVWSVPASALGKIFLALLCSWLCELCLFALVDFIELVLGHGEA